MNKYTELVKKLKIKPVEKTERFDPNTVFVAVPKANDISDKDNQILLRLLPDFVHGEEFNGPIQCSFHLFKSKKTGQMIRVNCPPESGEGFKTVCPLCKECITLYKANRQEERRAINRIICGYVNAYVVHNPFEPSQDGQIRILKYGRKVQPIIDDAATGRYASMFGNRIYDLSSDGCTFVYECNRSGQWVDYSRSYFKTPQESAADVKGLTEAKINKIYESVMDINEKCNLKPNTVKEVQDIIRTHINLDDEDDYQPDPDPEDEDAEADDDQGEVAESTDSRSQMSRATGDVAEADDGNEAVSRPTRDQQLDKLLEGL